MTIEFRDVRKNDLGCLCALHAQSFPNFFLTSLGPRFLYLLYAAFAREPDGIRVAADHRCIIIGFAESEEKPLTLQKSVI